MTNFLFNIFANLKLFFQRICKIDGLRKIVITVFISLIISSIISYKVLFPVFLSKNGDLIIKSVEEMYKKKEEESQKEGIKNVDAVYKDIISDNQLPYIGNKNGSKIVIEFFDYSCGHCKHQSNDLKTLVARDSNVKVILVDFPIMSQGSFVASSIAVHIYNKYPSKFVKFYNTVIGAPQIDQKIVESALLAVGLSKDLIANEMQKDQISREILQRNHQRATLLKLRGTPAILLKDRLLPGYVSADDLQKLF